MEKAHLLEGVWQKMREKKNWFCLVSKNVCKEQFFSYNIQVFFLRLPTNLPVPDKQIWWFANEAFLYAGSQRCRMLGLLNGFIRDKPSSWGISSWVTIHTLFLMKLQRVLRPLTVKTLDKTSWKMIINSFSGCKWPTLNEWHIWLFKHLFLARKDCFSPEPSKFLFYHTLRNCHTLNAFLLLLLSFSLDNPTVIFILSPLIPSLSSACIDTQHTAC